MEAGFAVSHEEFVRPRQDCLSRAKTEDGKDARRRSTERASSRNLTLLRSELDAHSYLPHSGATRLAENTAVRTACSRESRFEK